MGWTENDCINCHQSDEFYTKVPKLHRYYQKWLPSRHNQSGVTCDDCHGGDSTAETKDTAHSGIFAVGDERSLLYFKNQPQTCGKCHNDKQSEFKLSKHYQALETDTGSAPTCTTCHPAMNKQPSYHLIVLNSCNSCHEPGNERGLPAVADEAENLLRHLNMVQGLLGWTTLHYQSHSWPGDSNQKIARLKKEYSHIISHVHRFDLEQSSESTMSLLEELRSTFEAARNTPVDAKANTSKN
jgi:hypothetical protein